MYIQITNARTSSLDLNIFYSISHIQYLQFRFFIEYSHISIMHEFLKDFTSLHNFLKKTLYLLNFWCHECRNLIEMFWEGTKLNWIHLNFTHVAFLRLFNYIPTYLIYFVHDISFSYKSHRPTNSVSTLYQYFLELKF